MVSARESHRLGFTPCPASTCGPGQAPNLSGHPSSRVTQGLQDRRDSDAVSPNDRTSVGRLAWAARRAAVAHQPMDTGPCWSAEATGRTASRRPEKPRRNEQGPERGGHVPVQRLSLSQSSSLTLTTPPAKQMQAQLPKLSTVREDEPLTSPHGPPVPLFIYFLVMLCGLWYFDFLTED